MQNKQGNKQANKLLGKRMGSQTSLSAKPIRQLFRAMCAGQWNETGQESAPETAAPVSNELSRNWNVCRITNKWIQQFNTNKTFQWTWMKAWIHAIWVKWKFKLTLIGLIRSTDWHREDTQKPRDRILGLTKSGQCSEGSFPDVNYKCVDFTLHFISLLVLQALMRAYYVPSRIPGINKQVAYHNSMRFML